MISQGKSMGGILIDQIEGWSPMQHSSNQISCHDTWIRLEGLPINLWNMPTYQSIGSHFGGLVEVASTTERKAYEQGAWIRVAGDINRFFPGQIEVPCWGTKVTITILTSISGNKNGEDEANVGPKADVADLEKLQQGGIADKEDGMEPVISAAACVSTGDTTANEQGVRTDPNGSKDGGHQNAINTGDVDLVSISRNSNTHQDKGKGKEILIHPDQHETYSIMGTTRLLKGLVLDGPNMCLGSPSSSHEKWTPTIKNNKMGPTPMNKELLQADPLVGDLGSDSSQEGQTPTIARLTDIRHVQDRAREDIIQDLQRGRLALSQGQIQGGDTPHPVRMSKSLVIRQHDSSPTVSEDSVHNGSKSDDSTSDDESSPNEYVQDSLDYGEYEDPELDFDQYELTGVPPGPQDKATTEPEDQSYTDIVLEIIDEAILTHLFAQPLEVDAVAAEMNNQTGIVRNQDIILNGESIPQQPSRIPNAENMGATMESRGTSNDSSSACSPKSVCKHPAKMRNSD
ncbi:hypothetical protein Syun_028890 [Stephania yunnanensis]|uniref:DUF4283 domain-containing protein n=1 Tax=Stephania yunnanensis TaxID=152371 RepID=A0AAP0E4M2_9MAGN